VWIACVGVRVCACVCARGLWLSGCVRWACRTEIRILKSLKDSNVTW
jgi:hypothetical protein